MEIKTKEEISSDERIICEFLGNEVIESYPEYSEKCLNNEQITNKINSKKYDSKDIRNNVLKNFYSKYMFRLSLTCTLNYKNEQNNKKDNITIILMNPSYADQYGLDDTISNVKNFLEKIGNKNDNFQYSRFEILNIFPIRISQSECLPCLLEKYDSDSDKSHCKQNTEYIIKKIEKGGDFILAWGADYHKRKETQEILENFNNLPKDKKNNINIFVYHLNTSKGREGTPSHFNSRVYNKLNKNNELKLIEVDIIKTKDKLLLEEKEIKLEL